MCGICLVRMAGGANVLACPGGNQLLLVACVQEGLSSMSTATERPIVLAACAQPLMPPQDRWLLL